MNQFKIIYSFIIAILLLSLASCSTNKVSNTQGQDQRPETTWSVKTDGGIWSSPIYLDGVVYFGNDSGTFYALNSSTGETVWEFKTEGMIRSTPAIKENTIYFISDDGFLYALERTTGAKTWSTNIGSSIRKSLPQETAYDYDYRQASPTLEGDIIYVGSSDNSLYSIDSIDGSINWKFDADSMIRSTPLVYNNKVYIASWSGAVYGINSKSGDEIWSYRAGSVINSDLAICDGNIIIGSRDTNLYALNLESGNVTWKYNFVDQSWIDSSAITVENGFFIGSSDSMKLLFYTKSGKVNWEYNTGGWSWGTPLVTEHTVYIGSIYSPSYTYFPQTTMALHAVDRVTGERKWRFKPESKSGFIKGGVFSTPVINENIIYFGSIDGTFYAINL